MRQQRATRREHSRIWGQWYPGGQKHFTPVALSSQPKPVRVNSLRRRLSAEHVFGAVNPEEAMAGSVGSMEPVDELSDEATAAVDASEGGPRHAPD